MEHSSSMDHGLLSTKSWYFDSTPRLYLRRIILDYNDLPYSCIYRIRPYIILYGCFHRKSPMSKHTSFGAVTPHTPPTTPPPAPPPLPIPYPFSKRDGTESETPNTNDRTTEETVRQETTEKKRARKQTEKKGKKEAASDDSKQGRGKWGNQLQFILSCVGYAVGLGNIWRFPKLAYENGGSAFLIPYYTCSLLFGLPGLYFEFILGQYTTSGASVAFGHYAPILQGIGWAMTLISGSIAIYYNVIIAWVVMYIYKTVGIASSGVYTWSSCRNEWNSDTCISYVDNQNCESINSTLSFYFNGSCHAASQQSILLLNGTVSTAVATEEYFLRHILERSEGVMETGGVNWSIFGCLVFVWICTALTMMFGVKIMGYTSYITATVPYIIVAILFVRGVTLDGASEGIKFYLLQPDFSKLFMLKTWAAALSQVCYSLSVGMGGLLSMASYNDRYHNCFRDAIIVVFSDSFMSVFGGVAVFSVLGFLAKLQNKPVQEVIQNSGGTGLTFIAYPEAMAQMPGGWVFALLFFFMLFLLGISSQFGLVDIIVTSIIDAKPNILWGKGRKIVSPLVCLVSFMMGICMCLNSGFYWFTIFDEYTGSIGMTVCGVLEFLGICYIYGLGNFRADIREMFGIPRNCVTSAIGPSGWYLAGSWAFVAPALGATIFGMAFYGMLKIPNLGNYVYPAWVLAVAWPLSVGPLLAIPIMAFVNYKKLKADGKTASELFKPQPTLPSYTRIKEMQAIMNSQESTDDDDSDQFSTIDDETAEVKTDTQPTAATV